MGKQKVEKGEYRGEYAENISYEIFRISKRY